MINAAAGEKDPNSPLNYFRKAVKLRMDNKALVYGRYTLPDRDNPDVYALKRKENGIRMLIISSFTAKKIAFFPDSCCNISGFNGG